MMVAASLRFQTKVVEVASGCWLWTGATNNHGYGQIRVDGQARYVHRLAYETFVAPIPNGFQIDHVCRNRRCVNPAHLEAVTQRVNILRGESPHARHARATHCVHGHPLSGKNLYVRPDGRGRHCKRCFLLRGRERALRRRQAVEVSS